MYATLKILLVLLQGHVDVTAEPVTACCRRCGDQRRVQRNADLWARDMRSHVSVAWHVSCDIPGSAKLVTLIAELATMRFQSWSQHAVIAEFITSCSHCELFIDTAENVSTARVNVSWVRPRVVQMWLCLLALAQS